MLRKDTLLKYHAARRANANRLLYRYLFAMSMRRSSLNKYTPILLFFFFYTLYRVLANGFREAYTL